MQIERNIKILSGEKHPPESNMLNNDEKIECLSCGWTGKESQLIRVQYWSENNYRIPGETTIVCPECKSAGWEYINESDNKTLNLKRLRNPMP